MRHCGTDSSVIRSPNQDSIAVRRMKREDGLREGGY
jgi:hypothetical protein